MRRTLLRVSAILLPLLILVTSTASIWRFVAIKAGPVFLFKGPGYVCLFHDHELWVWGIETHVPEGPPDYVVLRGNFSWKTFSFIEVGDAWLLLLSTTSAAGVWYTTRLRRKAGAFPINMIHA